MPSPSSRLWYVLISWYRKEGRTLPWRDNHDPYRVVVSEMMLQQTQVSRVVPKFLAFTKRYPTWAKLARASQASVIRAWKGLGYNMRAVRLRDLALEVMTTHRGQLPRDQETLLSLKGIGPYTARAIRVFGFRDRALAPDTNVRRVLTRLFLGPMNDPKAFNEALWSKWEATLPPRLSYDANQGLMDLGATICVAGVPNCPACPLKEFCASYPRILKIARKHLPKAKVARNERKDTHGIPDRIYRGRVIDRLRQSSASLGELCTIARKDIIDTLVKDALIRVEKGRFRLA